MTLEADLDRIAAESTRRSAAVIDELTTANARTAAIATDLATRSARAIEAIQRQRPPADPRQEPGPAQQEGRPDMALTPGEPGWPIPEHSDSGPAPQGAVSSRSDRGWLTPEDPSPASAGTAAATARTRGEPDPSLAPMAAPATGGRHAAPDPDENTRPLWRAPGPDDAEAGTAPLPVIEPNEEQRRREELQERRDAIARSIAARRAQSVARPSDQDDEEGEYYRRTSWLI
ncbi:hypothetical protein [Nocardia jiangsuensis]|uniref:Uncharacterized protein n=1 Tax=Nocardia jiangsuensis TaxID=1691563 RepID=A0ABV8DY47_9NOCA